MPRPKSKRTFRPCAVAAASVSHQMRMSCVGKTLGDEHRERRRCRSKTGKRMFQIVAVSVVEREGSEGLCALPARQQRRHLIERHEAVALPPQPPQRRVEKTGVISRCAFGSKAWGIVRADMMQGEDDAAPASFAHQPD